MRLVLSSLALLSLAALAPAQLTTAFSTFGANDAYGLNAAFRIDSANDVLVAFPFTPTVSGPLAAFDVAMGTSLPNQTATFALTLYSDASNSLGAPLGQFTGTTSTYTFDATKSDVVRVNASGLSLVAGTQYWLLANSTTTTGVIVQWNLALSGTTRYAAVQNGQAFAYANSTPTAFAVQVGTVQAVPEPLTMALGAAAFVGALKRRRKA